MPKNYKFMVQSIKIDEFLNINYKVRESLLFAGKSNNSNGDLKISSVHYEHNKDFYG